MPIQIPLPPVFWVELPNQNKSLANQIRAVLYCIRCVMQQGVVAQLGERLLDVQEVCGSSPHGPTGYRCTAAIFIWPLYLIVTGIIMTGAVQL